MGKSLMSCFFDSQCIVEIKCSNFFLKALYEPALLDCSNQMNSGSAAAGMIWNRRLWMAVCRCRSGVHGMWCVNTAYHLALFTVTVIRPHRMQTVRRCGLLLLMFRIVCLSVCLLDTTVSPIQKRLNRSRRCLGCGLGCAE